MIPLIGLTLEISTDSQKKRNYKKGWDLHLHNPLYAAWVIQSGALPIFLPPNATQDLPELLQHLDGLVLTGGSDLDPKLWNEEELEPGGLVHPLSAAEVERSTYEQKLCKVALDLDLPLLGICRGHQQLNVALGGSLFQDMERQQDIAGHSAFDHPFELIHEVDIKGLPQVEQGRQSVTSSHHQAIQNLGEGLDIVARDTTHPEVIEAISHPKKKYCVGVQWHPERMVDSTLSKALMKGFLQVAQGRRDAR